MRTLSGLVALLLVHSVAAVASADPDEAEQQGTPPKPSVVVTVDHDKVEVVTTVEDCEVGDDDATDDEDAIQRDEAGDDDVVDGEPAEPAPGHGPRRSRVRVSVPDRANPVERRAHPHHIWRGITIAGGVASGVAAGWLIAGAVLYADAPLDEWWNLQASYGIMFMSIGAIGSAVGIPLLIVGLANPGDRGHHRSPSPRVEFSVSGTGAMLSGSF
ncbi:MAG: hypothetical protein U0271_09740 [Polyangiaceae bacterium]